ncbi:MAG: hypothetical protein BRD50_04285 [Bacteroidetes bacterium SW_11_45_7]|nr:MAG: hypothetical protein BRD50_04285 [Bacteroidetes bacterium SW_11_45_7]
MNSCENIGIMATKLLTLIFLLSLICGNVYSDNQEGPILQGKWLITFQSDDIGVAKTVVTFHQQDSTFYAHTRKRAVGDILNFWKATFARIMTDDFKNGALLNITEGTITKKRNALILHGIFHSALGDYYFDGEVVFGSYYGGAVVKGKLNAELSNANGETRGTLTGKKANPSLPLHDYNTLVEEALDSAERNIYSPSPLQTNKWQRFKNRITKVAPRLQDDVEMVFAFFYYADKLPFSHFSLIKKKQQQGDTTTQTRYAHLTEKRESTGYLDIGSFAGRAEEIDSIFRVIQKREYKQLIVDLRGNTGGSVEAGLRFAQHVTDTTFNAGILLTEKWFSEHDTIPAYRDFNEFTHFTKANYNLLMDGINRKRGLVLKVIPRPNPYMGQLFLLTDGQTASTCEPIVYGLKQINRAQIIGATTAGSMLNAEYFQLADGFSLVVPTADYYTNDGYRIEQNGVEPDIKTDPSNALSYVMNNLISP